MKFQQGISGNPSGRPKGIKDRRTVYTETIEAMVPELLDALKKRALNGDIAAIKLMLDRVLPALKPASTPFTFESAEGLSNQANSVLNQVMNAEIPPEVGMSAISVIQGVARVVEFDDLLKRIEMLESATKG